MKIKILLLVLIIAGCATTEGYKRKMDAFIGLSEEQLIMKLGAPANVYETETAKYFTYFDKDYRMIMTVHGGAGVTSSCTTTFAIKNGIVKNHAFKGKLCISK